MAGRQRKAYKAPLHLILTPFTLERGLLQHDQQVARVQLPPLSAPLGHSLSEVISFRQILENEIGSSQRHRPISLRPVTQDLRVFTYAQTHLFCSVLFKVCTQISLSFVVIRKSDRSHCRHLCPPKYERLRTRVRDSVRSRLMRIAIGEMKILSRTSLTDSIPLNLACIGWEGRWCDDPPTLSVRRQGFLNLVT